MALIEGGPKSSYKGSSHWWDKIPSKFSNWSTNDFMKAGFRAVPGSIVRHSAFIGKNVVLMPSFVNLGAYVDEGTMVDTWATVGSCAQIGKNVHISGGAGIGGVLEPLQAGPVIVEDDCFIGARSEVAEGVVVEKGAVLSMGVYIGASTKIIDRSTGLLVTLKDSQALASAIELLIETPRLCKEMGKKGRQLAEKKFDVKEYLMSKLYHIFFIYHPYHLYL